MSKETLKELRQAFEWGKKHDCYNLDFPEIDWIFQEAEEKIQLEERVEELEKEVKHWKSCTDSEQKIAGRLQNKVNSLEKQNNELTGIGGMWMSARNKLEESQKLNQRYKQALESVYSIIQLAHLDEISGEQALKQIENLVIDSWESEGEA